MKSPTNEAMLRALEHVVDDLQGRLGRLRTALVEAPPGSIPLEIAHELIDIHGEYLDFREALLGATRRVRRPLSADSSLDGQ